MYNFDTFRNSREKPASKQIIKKQRYIKVVYVPQQTPPAINYQEEEISSVKPVVVEPVVVEPVVVEPVVVEPIVVEQINTNNKLLMHLAKRLHNKI